jgi:hypothetical protein
MLIIALLKSLVDVPPTKSVTNCDRTTRNSLRRIRFEAVKRRYPLSNWKALTGSIIRRARDGSMGAGLSLAVDVSFVKEV